MSWLVLATIRLLSYAIPKDPNLVVFLSGSTKGVIGNLKALLDHACVADPCRRYVWILRRRDHAKAFGDEKNTAIGFRGVWYLLRAALIVVDSAKPSLAQGRFRFIQLWHGAGYKNIGLGKSSGADNDLMRFYARCVLITANSEADRQRKVACFRNNRVVITGSPRNDIFFGSRPSHLPVDLSINGDRLIMYAPTFREHPRKVAFSRDQWEALNRMMGKYNWTFGVRRHPGDRHLCVPSDLPHIVDLTITQLDVQDLLVRTDLLVTDYSSIATDFALTGRPMVFYFYDYEEYIAYSRTFFYDPRKIVPGPIVEDFPALTQKLADWTWHRDQEYMDRYARFVAFFHEYQDGDSASRVCNALKSVIH